jgi:hypothetical protein
MLRVRRIAIASFAALAALITSGSTKNNSPPGTCVVYCYPDFTWHWHYAEVQAPHLEHTYGDDGAHSYLGAGSCEAANHSTACGFAPEDLQDVRTAASEGDAAALARLMVKYPTKIKVASHRDAIQVFDCTGVVRDHLPLAHSVVAALQQSAHFAE